MESRDISILRHEQKFVQLAFRAPARHLGAAFVGVAPDSSPFRDDDLRQTQSPCGTSLFLPLRETLRQNCSSQVLLSPVLSQCSKRIVPTGLHKNSQKLPKSVETSTVEQQVLDQ